jgi:hypothetical protein
MAAMFRLIATFVILAVLLAPLPLVAGGCYADWSVAAPIVHREGLTTVEALSRLAASKLAGEIVKTTLCEDGGEFVYRLVVRAPDGKLANRTVNARAPFGR